MRILRWALIGCYDEAILLLKANLAWFLISLPLGLPLLVVLAGALPPRGGDSEPGGVLTPWLLVALLLLLVPNPASLGLYRLAAAMDRRESPPWRDFWQTTAQNLRLGLGLFAIGLLGLLLLVVAARFYLQAGQPLLQALSLLYLYLALFWLALQLYLGPLVVLLGERRPLALYRRAALLVLAHPIQSLTLLLSIGLLVLLCVFLVPLYLGFAMAFVALVATRALAEHKRKYDPRPDPDEGMA